MWRGLIIVSKKLHNFWTHLLSSKAEPRSFSIVAPQNTQCLFAAPVVLGRASSKQGSEEKSGLHTVQRIAVLPKPVLCTKEPNLTMLFYYIKIPASSSPWLPTLPLTGGWK